AAVARWHAWDEAGRPETPRPRTVGVDVARSGTDRTVLALRTGPVVTELRRSVREDTMKTTGRVKGVIDADDGQRTPVVDVIGLGAGVVDRLREQGYKVLAFNAAGKSRGRDSTGEFGFINKRSEAWWSLREALDPSADPDICLPDDEMLLGDLSAPQWTVTSAGKIQVEDKAQIVRRLGRSTDDGDAVVQAFVPHLGEHVANARNWAGSRDLERVGRAPGPRGPAERARAQVRAVEQHQDQPADPWEQESFAPQPDQRPR